MGVRGGQCLIEGLWKQGESEEECQSEGMSE